MMVARKSLFVGLAVQLFAAFPVQGSNMMGMPPSMGFGPLQSLMFGIGQEHLPDFWPANENIDWALEAIDTLVDRKDVEGMSQVFSPIMRSDVLKIASRSILDHELNRLKERILPYRGISEDEIFLSDVYSKAKELDRCRKIAAALRIVPPFIGEKAKLYDPVFKLSRLLAKTVGSELLIRSVVDSYLGGSVTAKFDAILKFFGGIEKLVRRVSPVFGYIERYGLPAIELVDFAAAVRQRVKSSGWSTFRSDRALLEQTIAAGSKALMFLPDSLLAVPGRYVAKVIGGILYDVVLGDLDPGAATEKIAGIAEMIDPQMAGMLVQMAPMLVEQFKGILLANSAAGNLKEAIAEPLGRIALSLALPMKWFGTKLVMGTGKLILKPFISNRRGSNSEQPPLRKALPFETRKLLGKMTLDTPISIFLTPWLINFDMNGPKLKPGQNSTIGWLGKVHAGTRLGLGVYELFSVAIPLRSVLVLLRDGLKKEEDILNFVMGTTLTSLMFYASVMKTAKALSDLGPEWELVNSFIRNVEKVRKAPGIRQVSGTLSWLRQRKRELSSHWLGNMLVMLTSYGLFMLALVMLRRWLGTGESKVLNAVIKDITDGKLSSLERDDLIEAFNIIYPEEVIAKIAEADSVGALLPDLSEINRILDKAEIDLGEMRARLIKRYAMATETLMKGMEIYLNGIQNAASRNALKRIAHGYVSPYRFQYLAERGGDSWARALTQAAVELAYPYIAKAKKAKKLWNKILVKEKMELEAEKERLAAEAAAAP